MNSSSPMEDENHLDGRDSATATLAALTQGTPAAPGSLAAAPRTYLRQTTQEALQRFAPKMPSQPVPGRDVPVTLHRAVSQLDFKATIALADLDGDLCADLDELDQ